VFEERRQKVREAMGPGGVAIFLGAPLVIRSHDTPYPFRQDSDFWYLTGFDHPSAAAVLRTDGGPEYTLYVEPRDPGAESWTGYRPGIEGALRDYGADEAFAEDQLLEHVPQLVSGAKHVYHVLGRNARVDARITETIENLRRRSRQCASPPEAIIDPRNVVHEMRLFKEPAELDVIRRAIAISAEAHGEAARLAHGGAYEYQLEAVIEYTFRRRGARGAAYTTIVGAGPNATVLHYINNDQKLRDGQLVLIDAGCELEGYASDVTRTYPVDGRFSGPGRALYEAVLAAQQAALEVCRPGETLAGIHDAAMHKLVEGLVDLGLLSGDVDELIAAEKHKVLCMHATSHWLGLDVHDVGAYRLGGEHRRLEPGMVFTVEPGVYVAESNEDVDVRFRGIGVRIEDDVAITREGHENLSAAIPKAADDLEALVSDR
jgi:Xaa-Pro aminopeptidase